MNPKVVMLLLAALAVAALPAAHAQGNSNLQGSISIANSPPVIGDVTATAVLGERVTITFDGVSDPNGDPVTLSLRTSGVGTEKPQASPSFHSAIDLDSLVGFTQDQGPDFTVTEQATAAATPEISFMFNDRAEAGTYQILYTGNDGEVDSETATITIRAVDEFTANTITSTAMHGDPVTLDFASAITHDIPIGELTITFTLDDIQAGTANPAPHNLAAGEDVEERQDGSFRVTGTDGTITLTSNQDSARTVTGTYTVSDGTNTRTAAITITLTSMPVCSNTVAASIDFGSLEIGDTSDDQMITITNSGTAESSLLLQGEDWVDGSGNTLMGPGQTRYSTAAAQEHGSKTQLTGTVAELVSGLGASDTQDVYMSLLLELSDRSFKGSLTQDITVTSTCG